MWERAAFCVLAVLLAGCGDGILEPVATVRFELGDEAPAFGDVPFPSELYRDGAGRIALGAFPNPLWDAPMFSAVRELLAERDGFCTSCNVTFMIDGGVDALPSDDTLRGGPSAADGVALVDISPSSPEYGRHVPLRAQLDGERLTLRPARGETLRPAQRYAAVLTSALSSRGTPLGAAPSFVRVRDDAPNDAAEARAAQRLAPTFAALDALGLERETIVGVAAFTTADPSRDLLAMRARLAAAEPPAATVDAVFDGAALDELLGVPTMPGPGVDLEPLGEGLRAIAHETTALVVSGSFSAPRFVEGTGTDVGALRRDEDALPLITGSDQVPFVLIVPQGADMTRLPLVVSQHGFSASRTTGFALADSAGRAGHAVLAIDAFQHGERAKSARDELHALRGDVDGADGFAETTQLDVSSRMFGLSGGADGMALFPGYAQAAFAQFAADVMSAVRLAREGDIDAIRAAHPLLSNLAFDADHIAFVGNSMGAVVGMSLMVAEPHVRAAVLNVLPGSIVETLCESGEFRSLTSTLLLPQVGVSEVFDEIDRAMVFDPTVDLLRWVLEPIDPLALARYLAVDRRAAAGPVPDVLIQLAGHDEVAAPTASESVVSAARIAGHGAFQFAPVDALSLPASGSQVTGAVRFAGAMHGMLEVHTQASRFEAPLLPPLVPRAEQVGVDNPIDDVHAQIETFLRSFLEEGHGTIAIP